MFRTECKAYLKVLESLDSPVSLSCALLVKYKEWDQLAVKVINPADYNCKNAFADDYLAVSVMRKNQRMPTTFNRKQAAYEKFYDSERVCKETNERISGFSTGTISVSSDIRAVISHAQQIITGILGPLTQSKLAFAEANFRFGPGATTSVSGEAVSLSRKFTGSLHVTPRLYPYWRSLTPVLWRRAVRDVSLRCSSKVTCVPKDATIDRVIAIEPHLNIFVQLGIGALLRRQLGVFGLDLNDQTRNQQLAKVAIHRNLATIDLSSASDSISRELVWLMLPFEWASLLDLPRTEYAEVEGREVRLEKFSSMGNGYTFELESLIFYALALAASSTREGVSAYGDDIICPQSAAPLLIDALNFLGFKVNTRKTFLAGRFYESCGMDFFDGANVRPFFWKGNQHEPTQIIFGLANGVRRYAHMRLNSLGCDIRFLPCWLYLVSRLSVRDRSCFIPLGYGDGGLVGNLDESHASRSRYWVESYISRCYVDIGVKRRADPLGVVVATLHSMSLRGVQSKHYVRYDPHGSHRILALQQTSSASYGFEPIRGRSRYRKLPVMFYDWPSLGCWE